jgi:hypothetical protein
MKRLVGLFLTCLLLTNSAAWASVGSHNAQFIGGTIASIKPGDEGSMSTSDEKVLVFTYKDGKLEIPYDQVNDLEYGQKAGRRLGLALVVSPWLLLSKKRKHFLTIGYTDAAGKQQAGVFELGKDVVRTTIVSLEARTGKKIEFEDDEARKSGYGN